MLSTGASKANLGATKHGNLHANIKESNTRSMNLHKMLRKFVSRLEEDFQHKRICYYSSKQLVAMATFFNPSTGLT
jgi:hypothetical protein